SQAKTTLHIGVCSTDRSLGCIGRTQSCISRTPNSTDKIL
ncbi:hypothetical protein Gohar_026873, partial [Gossypium harknessii]|nr:hypothetical protein [Gossypium harknessii]